MQRTTRRRFLGTTLLSAALLPTRSPVRAMEPLGRQGAARLRLSLAAYSFRQFFKTPSPPSGVAAERLIDLFQFIDYCAEHGCEGTELTSYYFPADLDAAYLLRIRRHAFLRGIPISGTAVGNTFTWPRGAKRDQEMAHVKRWIDRAAVMGAPHIRIFAGNRPEGMSLAESKRSASRPSTKRRLRRAKGRVPGNRKPRRHCRRTRRSAGHRARRGEPWLGINLDTGNFHTADPYADLAGCAPYAVNVQVKVEIQARGQPKGPADLARLVQLVRDSGYQGYVRSSMRPPKIRGWRCRRCCVSSGR